MCSSHHAGLVRVRKAAGRRQPGSAQGVGSAIAPLIKEYPSDSAVNDHLEPSAQGRVSGRRRRMTRRRLFLHGSCRPSCPPSGRRVILGGGSHSKRWIGPHVPKG